MIGDGVSCRDSSDMIVTQQMLSPQFSGMMTLAM